MTDEKSQGSGTATVEASGENMVQVTFLPEERPSNLKTANCLIKIMERAVAP